MWALKRGEVHVAGIHLAEESSGVWRLPNLRYSLGDYRLHGRDICHWEEGFIIPHGNPKKIRSIADIARPTVRIVNTGVQLDEGVRKSLLTALFLFVVLAWTQASVYADEILVSAAASLTDVLKEISSGYQSKTKHTVKFNFGPSSGLARQIEEGAPADLFFSADLPQMEKLDKNGRLEPDTRKNLLSNQLVIIVPADSKFSLSSARGLMEVDIKRIALAEPSSVPVGVYSKKYLTDEGLWNKVEAKVVPVQDVRATLASVESGNVEAGFVYKTDAAVSKKVTIVYEVPIDKGPKITYPIAIVRESKRKEAARDFLNFVRSLAAKEVFKKYGFVVLD